MRKVPRPKSASNILQFPIQDVLTEHGLREQERRAVRQARASLVALNTNDDAVIDAILALELADSDKVKLIPELLNIDTVCISRSDDRGDLNGEEDDATS